MTRESDAPWPYGDVELPPEVAAPTWACPEGICQCDVTEGERGYEFSIMLCDHEGARMPGARCRIHVNGEIANQDDAFADGSGWITAVVESRPVTAFVEWAPAGTPLRRGYPYRAFYYVDLRPDDRAEAARRRLHNLGFSRYPTLRANIEAFQRWYRYGKVTGEIHDVERELGAYHDAASVPVVSLRDEPGQREEARAAAMRPMAFDGVWSGPGGEDQPVDPGPGVPPSDPPPPPPPRGKEPTGVGLLQQLPSFPAVDQVVDPANVGVHECRYGFARIFTEWTAADGSIMRAVFWVFRDALKWVVPNDVQWSGWKESLDPFTGLERACRLPCSAPQGERAAQLVKMTPDDLQDQDPQGDITEESWSPVALPCLHLTPKLYDVRFLQADIQIDPPGQDIGAPTVISSNRFNQKINEQAMTAAAGADGPPRMLGDPGKIWALTNQVGKGMMGNVQNHREAVPPETPDYHAAQNYGWHSRRTPLTAAADTPGLWVIDGAGSMQGIAHPIGHIDYSQVLVLVAGWCAVAVLEDPDDTPSYSWMETERIYKSSILWPAAMVHGPLGATRYP